jgi:hypothetical protein
MSYFSHTGRPTTEQEILNGVVRDKGVLYFKNVIQFQGTYMNVILLKLSLRGFSRNSNTPYRIMCRLVTLNIALSGK